jgi:hypothetical protein
MTPGDHFLRPSLPRSGCAIAGPTAPDASAPVRAPTSSGQPASSRARGAHPADHRRRRADDARQRRYCSARRWHAADAGFHEVRFAGATWPGSDASGLAVVVYRAPGLTLNAMADTFAKGADDARSGTRSMPRHRSRGATGGAHDAAMREDPQTVHLAGGQPTPSTSSSARTSGSRDWTQRWRRATADVRGLKRRTMATSPGARRLRSRQRCANAIDHRSRVAVPRPIAHAAGGSTSDTPSIRPDAHPRRRPPGSGLMHPGFRGVELSIALGNAGPPQRVE